MFTRRAASVLACVAALGASLAQGATQLQPFTRVSVCTPFSVLVKPGAGYDVQVDADPVVQAAVSSQVSGDGTLSLETTKPFSTKAPIKVKGRRREETTPDFISKAHSYSCLVPLQATVTLPKSALEGVHVNSGSGWTVVSAGFAAGTFTASAAGNGGVLLEDLTTDTLKLSNSG